MFVKASFQLNLKWDLDPKVLPQSIGNGCNSTVENNNNNNKTHSSVGGCEVKLTADDQEKNERKFCVTCKIKEEPTVSESGKIISDTCCQTSQRPKYQKMVEDPGLSRCKHLVTQDVNDNLEFCESAGINSIDGNMNRIDESDCQMNYKSSDKTQGKLSKRIDKDCEFGYINESEARKDYNCNDKVGECSMVHLRENNISSGPAKNGICRRKIQSSKSASRTDECKESNIQRTTQCRDPLDARVRLFFHLNKKL